MKSVLKIGINFDKVRNNSVKNQYQDGFFVLSLLKVQVGNFNLLTGIIKNNLMNLRKLIKLFLLNKYYQKIHTFKPFFKIENSCVLKSSQIILSWANVG